MVASDRNFEKPGDFGSDSHLDTPMCRNKQAIVNTMIEDTVPSLDMLGKDLRHQASYISVQKLKSATAGHGKVGN